LKIILIGVLVQRRATIEIYQLSQDEALGLFTSPTRMKQGLVLQVEQRYHFKTRHRI